MKKFYKSLILAVALVAPAMSWAELKGSGTETDPYLLGTPEDLLEMRSVLQYGKMTHFKMIADIDMAGVTNWVPLNTSGNVQIALNEGATDEEAAIVEKESPAFGSDEEYTRFIGFDGDGHFIKNLICRTDPGYDQYRAARGWSYKSFFGVLAGYCRNTGFEGCTFVDNNMGGGLIAGYLGHPKYTAAGYDETVIENCYIAGAVKQTGTSYLGGIVGNVASKSTIKNCGVLVAAYGTGGAMVGGLIGRIGAEVSIENIDCWGNKQIDAVNFGGGPDKDAFLAGTKPIPYPSVGAIFAERKPEGVIKSLKNVYVPFSRLGGNFYEGNYFATPFGPMDEDRDDVSGILDRTVLTSPWTQKFGQVTVENGAFNGGTGENLKENYAQNCFEYDSDVNRIFVEMSRGGVMTSGLMYQNGNIETEYLLAEYSQPRWVMGRNNFAGGDGTLENPYLISNSNQLNAMYKAVSPTYTANFKLTQNIECGPFNYLPPLGWDAVTYTQSINFDGNYHVIEDFRPNSTYKGKYGPRGVVDVSYMSLFGVFAGTVKNLGVTGAMVRGKDHNEDGTSSLIDGAGILCAYAGHSDAKMGATFENCYVEGAILSNSYAGGLAGTTGNDVTINNCWASVDMIGLTSETVPTFAGGLLGRVAGHKLTINNSVARSGGEGMLTGNIAAGLATSNNDNSVIEINEAIAWVSSIEGVEDAAAAVIGKGSVKGTAHTFNGTKVNGAAISGGKTAAELLAIAQGWSAWSETKNNNGYPMLKWEAGEGGVAPVIGDNAVVAYGGEGVIYVKGASVVYNVNGQVVYSGVEETVNVPAGLYIVKVGGNATKVIVR
ncbi:MAG: T9SS type A sorting domain-containing protein [Muribaculaceae bacterium]|nr:T9SS type A sorting domain-containing protein [Muribaculaceae bacterium]